MSSLDPERGDQRPAGKGLGQAMPAFPNCAVWKGVALHSSGTLCIPWLTRAAARCSHTPVRRGFGEAQRLWGVPLDSPHYLEPGPPRSLGGNEPVTLARCFIRTQLALQLATLGTPGCPLEDAASFLPARPCTQATSPSLLGFWVPITTMLISWKRCSCSGHRAQIGAGGREQAQFCHAMCAGPRHPHPGWPPPLFWNVPCSTLPL